MKRWWWMVLLPALLSAADDKTARGAIVYRASCAVVYCHGPEGKPGRAPGLGGGRLDFRAIIAIATAGIPNTSMPAFGGRLKPEDIEAVAAYIVSLGGGAANSGGAPAVVPAEFRQGRALFFDSARIGACGACHEVGGWGNPVSLALQDLRTVRLQDLHAVATPDVVTARPRAEKPFPALVVEKATDRIRVYDLSSRLPVLRTFFADEVELTPGSEWRHRDAAALYSDAELVAIVRYLRWAAGQ
jgi:mono/diheme cytochrome c family protein